ncbi:MAG: M1 family aminopeptidase [Ignavibacteria bacterium]
MNYSVKNLIVDSTLDVRYYKLKLKILVDPDYIIGAAQIVATFLNPISNSFFIQFSDSLSIDSVLYNGELTAFSRSNGNVFFRRKNGDIVDLMIFYHGLPHPTGYGSFIFGNSYSSRSIWSLSEPFGASDWFPCKNSPEDKADSSEVWIQCRGDLTAVSNGVLISEIYNPDSTKTFIWKSKYPISPYLISIAVSNFVQYTNYYRYTSTDSLPIQHYIYPEEFVKVKSLLDQTPTMLEKFTTLFGEYPFIREKYGHAQFGVMGAMEHQTVTSIGFFSEEVIVHELAHQWFGDKITCRNWQHIWLNEGFATYGECLYKEAVYGKNAYNQYIAIKMDDAKKAVGSIFVQNPESINEIFNPYRSYAKGGVVLHMLRGILGDSLFFKAMKIYATDSSVAYKTATTAEFKSIVERVSGFSLNYFFDEWIYGENYPQYTINWNYAEQENNNYVVTISVNQRPNTTPPFFIMPIELKINMISGDTTFVVLNNQMVQTFQFLVKGQPTSLTFDPNNKILKTKSGDGIRETIRYFLAQNYPNPFNPGTTIEYEILNFVNVLLKVYDILGREVKTLVNEKQKPGKYKIFFSSENLASGVYFYSITAGNFHETKRMIIVR